MTISPGKKLFWGFSSCRLPGFWGSGVASAPLAGLFGVALVFAGVVLIRENRERLGRRLFLAGFALTLTMIGVGTARLLV